MNLEFPRQIIDKYSNVNFDKIASSERRGGTNGRTYRQADERTWRSYQSLFAIFAKAP